MLAFMMVIGPARLPDSNLSSCLASRQVSLQRGPKSGSLASRSGNMKTCLPTGKTCASVQRMIIAVVNSKGGVGKSTVSVHLAAWLRSQGHSVVLADCDTQHSSSQWIQEADPSIKAVCLDNPDVILNDLPGIAQDVDFVVADGPGSNTETSRALLLRAEFAVVPCKASMLEVRALAKATEVLRQAQDIRSGKPEAVIVLSMVGRNYRLTKDMKDAAASLRLPLAKTALTLKQIYADAPGQGTVVSGMGSRGHEAATEVEQLFREILPGAVSAKRAKKAAHG